MFNIIKKYFNGGWDKDFLEELRRKKFKAYLKIATKDEMFKDPRTSSIDKLILDLHKAFTEYKYHIKMTYKDPIKFKKMYDNKDIQLLEELFIIGEKCFEEYTTLTYRIQTEWDEELQKMFFDTVQEEMYDLLKENYLDLSEEMILLLATAIADCFYKEINNTYPNQVLFTENFFIDKADPYIVEYIQNLKNHCRNEVLDIYEEGLLETLKEEELKENLKNELLTELRQKLKL